MFLRRQQMCTLPRVLNKRLFASVTRSKSTFHLHPQSSCSNTAKSKEKEHALFVHHLPEIAQEFF